MRTYPPGSSIRQKNTATGGDPAPPSQNLERLRKAFDARLINEVKRYNGIPHHEPDELELRDAIAELLQGAASSPSTPPPQEQ